MSGFVWPSQRSFYKTLTILIILWYLYFLLRIMSVSMIWCDCDWMCIGAVLCSIVLWGCSVLTASVEWLSAGVTSVCEPVSLSHHPSTGERGTEMDHRRLSALFGDSVEHMTFKSSSASSSQLFWQRVCVCGFSWLYFRDKTVPWRQLNNKRLPFGDVLKGKLTLK